MLRLSFAVFLIAVGVWQLVVAIKFVVEKRKQQQAPQENPNERRDELQEDEAKAPSNDGQPKDE